MNISGLDDINRIIENRNGHKKLEMYKYVDLIYVC